MLLREFIKQKEVVHKENRETYQSTYILRYYLHSHSNCPFFTVLGMVSTRVRDRRTRCRPGTIALDLMMKPVKWIHTVWQR